VVDVHLMFGFASSPLYSPAGEAVKVREAIDSDRDKVLSIASSSFVYSRFHLDPQIPKLVADKIKRAWVDNYFSGKRGERLFVASIGPKVVGFLAVLKSSQSGQTIRAIDLVAVDKNYWKKGCGEQLVRHFISEGMRNKWRMSVGTQAANVPSIRLYEKCGFRLRESKYVLHAHANPPRPTHV
jgi:ribosomal protein S18 acetylase RimI-like enzyme